MLRRWVTRWLRAGCGQTSSLALQRTIVQVNAAGLVLLVGLTGFEIAYVLSGNPALRRAGLIQLPSMVIAAALPVLNRVGHRALARWLLTIGSTATIVVAVRFSSGTQLDLHFVFIVLAIATTLLFPFDAWRKVAPVVVLDTALFLWCEFVGVGAPPDLYPLPQTMATLFRFGYVGTTLAAIFVMTWVAERSNHLNDLALEELSGIDPLTGLPNRRRLLQRLDEAITMSQRIRQHIGVLFMDLDNFKPLNDRAGHEAGDELLRQVARRLGRCVRKMDLAARLGGDEFVVVVSHLGNDRDAAVARLRILAESIRNKIAQPFEISRDGGSILTHACTASIGGIVLLGGERDPDTIIQQADAAMFRAKEAGRNRVMLDSGPVRSSAAGAA